MWYVHYYIEGVEYLTDIGEGRAAWNCFVAMAIWKPMRKAWLEGRKDGYYDIYRHPHLPTPRVW